MKPFNYHLDDYLRRKGIKFYLRNDGLWLSHKSKAYRLTAYRNGVAVESPLLNDKTYEFDDVDDFIAWFEKL